MRERVRRFSIVHVSIGAMFVVLSAVGGVQAERSVYEVGGQVESFELPDQHGQNHRIGSNVRVIIFSRDQKGGAIVRGAMGKDGADLLKRTASVNVTNLSALPGFISRSMVIPSMKDRGYPVLIDVDGDETSDIPHIEDQATLVFLDGLKIVRIVHFDASKGVRRALEASATAGRATRAPPR